MLSSVPTQKKRNPKSYTVPILVGCISILIIALSGISGLYYFESQTDPTIIVINETPNDTDDKNLNVKQNTTKKIKKVDKKNTTKSTKTTKKTKSQMKNATNST